MKGSGAVNSLFSPLAQFEGSIYLIQDIGKAGCVNVGEVIEDYLWKGNIKKYIEAVEGEVVEEAEEECSEG